MQTIVYKRPALGQQARLGSLYDARTDRFLPETILTEMSKEDIESIELNQATTIFSNSDTHKDKFEMMAIGPEFMATILAGSTNLQGSGNYLTEQRASFPSAHRAMHYSLHTSEDKLNLFGNSAGQHIDVNQFNRQEPTHIVTEIVWGAHCVISATRRISSEEDRDTAQKSLEDTFNQLETDHHPKPVLRQFSGQFYSSGGDAKDQALAIKVYTDLQSEGHVAVEISLRQNNT